jgi:hypothetical protein
VQVWHNYAFDRHMLANHGIEVRGFGGDTMHMARLVRACVLYVVLVYDTDACPSTCTLAAQWHAARLFGLGGYSLEGLTKDFLDRGKIGA